MPSKDGSVNWLHTPGNSQADMGEHTDVGFDGEMTITRASVLLGEGSTLFGVVNSDIKHEQTQATAFANDFIQKNSVVNYQK